jgi:hypothetical protein
MSKFLRLLFVTFFATMFLAACATTTEYAKQAYDYGKQATSWVGQKIESLYAKEGTPSAVEPQPDGGKIIEYRKTQTVDAAPVAPPSPTPALTAEKTTPPGASPLPPNTRVVPCTTRYRTDSTGTIRSWTIDGAGCKAVEEAPVENK